MDFKHRPNRDKSNGLRIGLIRFSSLGDILLTLSSIRTLKRDIPDCFLAVIVKEQYAELFDHNPFVDKVLPLSPRKGTVRFPLLDLMQRIKNERLDILLDLHANLRSRLVGFSFKPGRVIRYRKGSLQRRFFVLTGTLPGRFQTVSERYLRAISNIQGVDGLSDFCSSQLLTVHPRESENAVSIIESAFPGSGKVIGIAPGATHFTKMWPVEKYSQLIKLIQSSDKQIKGIVLFGDSSERDLGRSLKETAPDYVLDRTGCLTLRETAAYMSTCDVMITNDTGLMHMSTAVQTPVIAMFGPTSREFGFFPVGDQATVIEKDVACRPCSLHGNSRCPIGTFECLNTITAENVHERLQAVLEKR